MFNVNPARVVCKQGVDALMYQTNCQLGLAWPEGSVSCDAYSSWLVCGEGVFRLDHTLCVAGRGSLADWISVSAVVAARCVKIVVWD